jgi:methyltransferase-like protein
MTTCFVKKGEFVARAIAGETVVVPVRGQVGDLNAIYNFNDVGTFIWEHIDGSTNVRQIVDAVANEFEITPEVAERDALEFIASLETAGMIEPAVEGR